MRLPPVLMILLFPAWLFPQNPANVSGRVTDENNLPLPGCHVKLGEIHTVTDLKGRFTFNEISKPNALLSLSFIGYHSFDTLLVLNANHYLTVRLAPENLYLEEVAVHGTNNTPRGGLARETVQGDKLRQTMNGTLTRTLDRLPGFNSLDIGASASKPVIRGMGFNRVVVLNNGIKQEGQQWGADHGLEIDPFLTERVDVIKGAASLEHGSEAIGGILQVTSNKIPVEGFNGNLQLLGKTVNETFGGSLLLEGSNNGLFFKTRASALDFGDYRIPTNQIVYLTRPTPVYNGRLKNTAGKEEYIYVQTGITRSNWQSSISGSGVWQKSGFFPGAHGIPDLGRVAHDGDFRDIDYPFHRIEHLKLVSNSQFQTGRSHFMIDFGYQRNHRQEWSLFHTHFGDIDPPAINPDLEKDFKLNTFSANSNWTWLADPMFSVITGVQYQGQDSRSAGYGFFLPDFKRNTIGMFIKTRWQLNQNTSLASGIRYDHASINTTGFFDNILYNYMIERGQNVSEATFHAQRAVDINKQFGNATWLASLMHEPSDGIRLTFNAGTSFRIPTAIELSANGMHHGSFRHESGSANLLPEKGYFIDGGIKVQRERFSLMASPYLYYFTNYIFLSPSGDWSRLPHAGQVFRYLQSEAITGGVEVSTTHDIGRQLELHVNGEWLVNSQIERDGNSSFPLPFSPPASLFTELTYNFTSNGKPDGTKISVHGQSTARQNRVARNEAATPGYFTMGLGIHTGVKAGSSRLLIDARVFNILNRKYYNHISFYRKLEIPQPGRNLQLLLSLEF